MFDGDGVGGAAYAAWWKVARFFYTPPRFTATTARALAHCGEHGEHYLFLPARTRHTHR